MIKTLEGPHPKIKIEDCKDVARKRNWNLVSTMFVSYKTPLLWTCEKGHSVEHAT